MRRLEVDSLSNQDIYNAGAGLLAGSYTADDERGLFVRVFLDQVAGNGDYSAWIDVQSAGAGSFYRMQPKTTASVASGQTSIGFPSIQLPVYDGDIVRVYVLGLAADTTTPDTRVEFWESDYVKPATADRTLAIDASGQTTLGTLSAAALAQILSDATPFAGANINATISSRSTFDSTTDNVTVGALITAAISQFFTTDTGLEWSDSVDGSVVKEVLDGVPPSSVGAAAIWAYVTRTLTQSAAQLADAVSGSTITIQRGDTLSAAITNIGALTDYVSVDWTVKRKKTDADSAAVLRVRKNLSGTGDGLLRINGAAPSDATDASITIDDLAGGDITIAVDANITAELTPQNQQMYYDIQMITASGVYTMAEGLCNISMDITQAIV